MLNGLYGYIFGGDSAETSVGGEIQPTGGPSSSQKSKAKGGNELGEWILVEEEGKLDAKCETKPASMKVGSQHLLDECRSLSSSAPSMHTSWCGESELGGSTATALPIDRDAGKRAVEKEQQRLAQVAVQQQRQFLTKMLFSDTDTNKAMSCSPNDLAFEVPMPHANPNSDKRLKRSSKVETVQPKAKPRSKKTGAKSNANRNNDRKCNPHNIG